MRSAMDLFDFEKSTNLKHPSGHQQNYSSMLLGQTFWHQDNDDNDGDGRDDDCGLIGIWSLVPVSWVQRPRRRATGSTGSRYQLHDTDEWFCSRKNDTCLLVLFSVAFDILTNKHTILHVFASTSTSGGIVDHLKAIAIEIVTLLSSA